MLRALLFMLMFSVETYSKQCTVSDNVTLRDQGRSFDQGGGETQNQLNTGICYANSLSLTLEALTGKQISATQLALFNKQAIDRSHLEEGQHWTEGGFVCRVFNQVKKAQRKNAPFYRLCESDKSVDNLPEFKKSDKAYLTQVESFFNDLKSGKVSTGRLKGIFSVLKNRRHQLRKTCDKTSEQYNPTIYRHGLGQSLKHRCASADFRIESHKRKIEKTISEIKELKKPVSIKGKTQEELQLIEERKLALSLVIKEKSRKVERLKNKIQNESKIMNKICDVSKFEMVGKNRVYQLNESINKNVIEFANRMPKGPEKSVDGNFIKSEVLKFMRKSFPTKMDSDSPFGFPEDLLNRDQRLTMIPKEEFRKKFGLSNSCLINLHDQLSELVSQQGKICYQDKDFGTGISEKLKQSLLILLHVSQESEQPSFDEMMNRLLETRVKNVRGFMQNVFAYCRPEEGYQIPQGLRCGSLDKDRFVSRIERQSDRAECIPKYVDNGIVNTILQRSCTKIKDYHRLEDYCYDEKSFKKMLACEKKKNLERRSEKLRKFARRLLNTKIGNKKGMPLMISICPHFLKGGENSYKYITSGSPRNFFEARNLFGPGRPCRSSTGKVASHAVTIVGQRCVDGKMEYQIQNSWGKTCKPYMKEGQPLFECDPKNGTVWVPEEKLIMNLNSISGLSSSQVPIPKIKPGLRP